MKISQINIQNLRQFADISIDLTYPKGHDKEGQPLEKVCIIGQNGTGKTTILNLIEDFYLHHNSDEIAGIITSVAKKNFNWLPDAACVNMLVSLIGSIAREGLVGEKGRYNHDHEFKGAKKFKPATFIYIPFGINSRYVSDVLSSDDDIIKSWVDLFPKYFFGFPEALIAFERYINEGLVAYKKQNANYKLHLINQLERGEKIDLLEELKKWQKQHPNALENVAAYLDKLLNRFYLRTKTNVESTDEINSVQLESMVSGETIDIKELSSGTRQILNTARPIYHLLQKDSIVLIDEPETSLYPDLQRDIISYYTELREDLAGEVQYFFATHSPIVASAFDPWEIVDLEFDATGKVVRHLYYEGENHIDNYKIHPKYLRWDSILNQVFDVKASGDATREEAISELAELNLKIAYWKKEGRMANPTAEMERELARRKKLLRQMDWRPTNDANL